MNVERSGDWKGIKRKINESTGVNLSIALRQATLKNALFLVREIVRGIKSQSPGGEPFVTLAESTINAKGSSKALIDTGFLINSITQKIMQDKAFVGLLRTSMNKNGESMANIGAIMEFGATINHPNGTVIIIPPRPFLHPVMKKYQSQIQENYRIAIKSVL